MPTSQELTDTLIGRFSREMIEDMEKGIGVDACGGGFTNITGSRGFDSFEPLLSCNEGMAVIRELRKRFPVAFDAWQSDWANKLAACEDIELKALRKILRPSDKALMEGHPNLEKIARKYHIFD